MKALPLADPKNFMWQSYVHGVDPPWVTGIPQVDYDTYFNKCNHGPHFLTWHRWYTMIREEIVRQLCGDNAFNNLLVQPNINSYEDIRGKAVGVLLK